MASSAFGPTDGEVMAAFSDLRGSESVFGPEDQRTEEARGALRGLLAAYAAAHSNPIFGVPQYCGTREALRRGTACLRARPSQEEVERLLGPTAKEAEAAVEAARLALEKAHEAAVEAEQEWVRPGGIPFGDPTEVRHAKWLAFKAAAKRRDDARADLAEARRKL